MIVRFALVIQPHPTHSAHDEFAKPETLHHKPPKGDRTVIIHILHKPPKVGDSRPHDFYLMAITLINSTLHQLATSLSPFLIMHGNIHTRHS